MNQIPCLLLTGATGFIGSHVAERLLRDGQFRIIAIIRKKKNRNIVGELEKRGVIAIEGCFYDEVLLQNVFNNYRVTHVIHLAAIRGAGTGRDKEYDDVNVLGTEKILNASLMNGVRRFLFCSSVGVSGTIPSELPANEQTRMNDDNMYHRSKILAERKVEEYMKKGLDVIILRPTIVYGSGDNGFPAKLVKMVRQRILPLPRRDNFIHLVDVKEVADIFAKLLNVYENIQRVLIVADREPISLRELANLIHKYYYGKEYRGYLVLPEPVIITIETLLRMLNSRKWLTSFQLLFRSWYYDTAALLSLPGLEFTETKAGFTKFLEGLNDNKNDKTEI